MSRCVACNKLMSDVDISNDEEMCLFCLSISESTLDELLQKEYKPNTTHLKDCDYE